MEEKAQLLDFLNFKTSWAQSRPALSNENEAEGKQCVNDTHRDGQVPREQQWHLLFDEKSREILPQLLQRGP